MSKSPSWHAVDECLADHSEAFEKRVKTASAALLDGKNNAIAYGLGVNAEEIKRIGGQQSPKRKPRAFTSPLRATQGRTATLKRSAFLFGTLRPAFFILKWFD